MKFGSSVLSEMSKAELVAQAIYQRVRRGEPYTAFDAAFTELVQQILNRGDAFAGQIREQIRLALEFRFSQISCQVLAGCFCPGNLRALPPLPSTWNRESPS